MTRPTLLVDDSTTSKAAELVAVTAHADPIIQPHSANNTDTDNNKDNTAESYRASSPSPSGYPRITTDSGEITSFASVLLHLTADTDLSVSTTEQQTEL